MVKPDPTPEPRPVKRTLFIQVDDDGVREIFEPDDELMGSLGWIRADLTAEEGAEFAKLLDDPPRVLPGLAEVIRRHTERAEAVSGNGVNGHAIPDLVEPMTPLELADRVPLTDLVNDYRAQHFPPNARNSGDIALELVTSLIRVLETEREAGA